MESVPIGFVAVAEIVVIRDRAIEGVEVLTVATRGISGAKGTRVSRLLCKSLLLLI